MRIVGSFVELRFERKDFIPKIYDALEIEIYDGKKVALKCQKYNDCAVVRAIAMDFSDDLIRGMYFVNLYRPIQVPINGEAFNVNIEVLNGIIYIIGL